jgi:hypothetical protein
MAEPISALAWSVLLAGFLQLALQFPPLLRLSLLPAAVGFQGCQRKASAVGDGAGNIRSLSHANQSVDGYLYSFVS